MEWKKDRSKERKERQTEVRKKKGKKERQK